MIDRFCSAPPLLLALLAGLLTWFITALGAAAVFCFKGETGKEQGGLLGFAAGVMLAASCWSLLEPSIRLAGEMGLPGWLPAGVGFLCGGLFLRLTEAVLSRGSREGGEARRRMLLLSITLHNIPEGLAVGVAFGALRASADAETLLAAFSVALGIGIQNYPEGAAVSLPLWQSGLKRGRSFFLAQATGWVEPLAALLGAALVVWVRSLLPWALAFAAGAMVFVTAQELIPACQRGREKPYAATMGVLLGFAVMMVLDVALG